MDKKMEKTDIKSMNLAELTAYIEGLGEKKFRARQIYEWLHKKQAASFAEMTNISKALAARLEQGAELVNLGCEAVQVSKTDGTRKYLFSLADGNVIESVFMRYRHGNSVCISSQAGCRMGCRFCASTIGGLSRNLLPSEMLDQIYKITRDTAERVSNVVVMGTGEPLDNFDNLVKFLELLTDENGLNIGGRSVTVSTCGIVPKIKELADMGLSVTLALSLHAPTQEKRRALMPVAEKYGIREVVDACRYYFEKTGRRITFEYSLIGGVNDSARDAEDLCALLRGINCHVNLIPVNPVREREFFQPSAATTARFERALNARGLTVTVRRELGRDIDGACGQLRRRYAERNTF